ncbi:MAG: ATP synthase F0 subunit C [Bacteroidales bacterium]|nr:ATP synthase F0 subunit C [Bacteroidales bacterium]MDD3200762.1 ATP synthase F0 subunit C [Bacteroidales bacterium]
MELGSLPAVIASAAVVFAAAWGISRLMKSAMDTIARQPETADKVRMTLIVAAALIEGVSLFAVAVCFMSL